MTHNIEFHNSKEKDSPNFQKGKKVKIVEKNLPGISCLNSNAEKRGKWSNVFKILRENYF